MQTSKYIILTWCRIASQISKCVSLEFNLHFPAFLDEMITVLDGKRTSILKFACGQVVIDSLRLSP